MPTTKGQGWAVVSQRTGRVCYFSEHWALAIFPSRKDAEAWIGRNGPDWRETWAIKRVRFRS